MTTARIAISKRTQVLVLFVLALAIGAAALVAGLTSPASQATTNQAICSEHFVAVVGSVLVCENYADSSWGGDF
jgi:hypothetical protein